MSTHTTPDAFDRMYATPISTPEVPGRPIIDPRLQKRPSNMPKNCVKHYTAGHVYIFDDVPRNGATTMGGTPASLRHESNCDSIERFFTASTNYHVHPVRFTLPRFSEQNFIDWWKRTLNGHTEDEFVIVYFHGLATGRGEDYRFHFRTRPSTLNAFDLFQATNTTNIDCLYLMDCNLPNRFRDKIRDVPRREHGHSDYIAAGQALLDHNEHIVHEAGFTQQLTSYLAEWATGRTIKYCDHHMRLSVPEIMRHNRRLTSNPLRIWNSKTSSRREEKVFRFCIEVNTTLRTRRLDWVRVQIQGLIAEDNNEVDEPNVDLDEGQVETEEEDDIQADDAANHASGAALQTSRVSSNQQQQPIANIDLEDITEIDGDDRDLFFVREVIDLTSSEDIKAEPRTVPPWALSVVKTERDNDDVIMQSVEGRQTQEQSLFVEQA